jgi:hypothetical protein
VGHWLSHPRKFFKYFWNVKMKAYMDLGVVARPEPSGKGMVALQWDGLQNS